MADFKQNSGSADHRFLLDEVLFEITYIGNAARVAALDPRTNTEVTVMGSAHLSIYSLKLNALRKLKRALIKASEQSDS